MIPRIIIFSFFFPALSCEDCWWTGCQPSSWAVTGCQQYDRIEKSKEGCADGFKYECCTSTETTSSPKITTTTTTEVPLCSEGYWTGCQLKTWAVVGCDQYNMTTWETKSCPDGKLYHCCPRGSVPEPEPEKRPIDETDPQTGLSYLNLAKFLISRNTEFMSPDRLSCLTIDPDKFYKIKIGDFAVPFCNLCPTLNQLIYTHRLLNQDPGAIKQKISLADCFGSCTENTSCVALSHDAVTRTCYLFESTESTMSNDIAFTTIIMTQPSGMISQWMYSRNTRITGKEESSLKASSFQDCIELGNRLKPQTASTAAVSYQFMSHDCLLFTDIRKAGASFVSGHASAFIVSNDFDVDSNFEVMNDVLLIPYIDKYSFLYGNCTSFNQSVASYHRPQCLLAPQPGCIPGTACKLCYYPEKGGQRNPDVEICPDSFELKYRKMMDRINTQLSNCATTQACIAVSFDQYFNPSIITPANVGLINNETIAYVANYPGYKLMPTFVLQKSPVQSDEHYTEVLSQSMEACVKECNQKAGCNRLAFNQQSRVCKMSSADGLMFATDKGSSEIVALREYGVNYTGIRYTEIPGFSAEPEIAGQYLLDHKECRSQCASFCQSECNSMDKCTTIVMRYEETSPTVSCYLYSSGNITLSDESRSRVYKKLSAINITEESMNAMPLFQSSDVFGCYDHGNRLSSQSQSSLAFQSASNESNPVTDVTLSRQRRGFFSAIGNFFKKAGEAVVNTVKGVAEDIGNVVKAGAHLITGDVDKAGEDIKKVGIVNEVINVGKGVGSLLKGDVEGAKESFAETAIGQTVTAAKDAVGGLIEGDFDKAAGAAGELGVGLIASRFGVRGAKGGKKGGKRSVDDEVKHEKNKRDSEKHSAEDKKNKQQEKENNEKRKDSCKVKRRSKRATSKQPSRNNKNDDCDDNYCPALTDKNIIKPNSKTPACATTKEGKSCKFECSPGFDEQPNYDLKCVKSGDDLKWNKINIRCEQESCPASGIIVMSTPHPSSFSERKVTAYVVKFDKRRKIPSWSVGMFQGNEFKASDFTHLAAKESAGRHNSFLKHHCPSLTTSQANDKSYVNQRWERGHLTPAQAVRWSPKATRSVNLYINVAPQDATVNKEIWKPLEAATYCFSKKTRTIVATGTCDKSIASMNGIDVPECFWKMICYRDENEKHQVVGFLASNKDLPKSDLATRKKEAFQPKNQLEILATAGILSNPFLAAARDIVKGREELAISPGVDAIDTANPVSCAAATKISAEVSKQWSDSLTANPLKRKHGTRRRRAAGKRDCKPCNAQEMGDFLDSLPIPLSEDGDDEEIGSTDSLVSSSRCGKRIVGYYPSWGTRSFSPRMAQRLTHVIFAFLETKADGEVKVGCVDPAHTSNCDDDEKTAAKRLAQMMRVASQFDHLNIMFAVGGWENSQYFSGIAASRDKRLNFIASIIKAINEHDFDGVDIDWEYPVTGGAHEGIAADKQNYVTLLSELRAALSNLAKMNGRTQPYLMSVAGAAGQWTLDPGYDIPGLIEHLDFINVMTYDYFGAWGSKWGAYTGPPAPLFFGMPKRFSGKTNVAWTIKYYACHSHLPHKINMGVPFYGRFWENVGSAIDESDQMWRRADAVDGVFKGGAMTYAQVMGNISAAGFQQNFHEKTKSKYAYNPSSRVYIGFDDLETMDYKIKFAQEKNVGGIMIWALDQDDEQLSMLDKVSSSDLCGNTNPSDVPFKCLPTDEILWWTPENSDENRQGMCGKAAPQINGRFPVCDPDDPGYSCCSKTGYCGSGDEFCKCEGCVDYAADPDKILEYSKSPPPSASSI